MVLFNSCLGVIAKSVLETKVGFLLPSVVICIYSQAHEKMQKKINFIGPLLHP